MCHGFALDKCPLLCLVILLLCISLSKLFCLRLKNSLYIHWFHRKPLHLLWKSNFRGRKTGRLLFLWFVLCMVKAGFLSFLFIYLFIYFFSTCSELCDTAYYCGRLQRGWSWTVFQYASAGCVTGTFSTDAPRAFQVANRVQIDISPFRAEH